ncbi:M48 family metallopeptidase [Tepidicaulis sp.]|jgi:hypothetical protein|uniref:M48 family metallopeptidase n=1 Tax=Tepidicaulis sp. TaxID=1920809 RepID=UPI003B5AD7DB
MSKPPRSSALLTNVIEVDGRRLPVTVRHNPRARRFVLRVDLTAGRICVTSPSRRGMPAALSFAREHKDWIAEQLQIVPDAVPFAPGALIPFRGVMHEIVHEAGARGTVRVEQGSETALPKLIVRGDENFLARRLTDWLKAQARAALNECVLHHSAHVGVRPKRITLRDQTSRWGSCSSSRALSFSWRLIFAPPHVLDYVAAHEAAHLVHMNHGFGFWRLVAELMPDYRAAMKWLESEGPGLHRYGSETGFFESADLAEV